MEVVLKYEDLIVFNKKVLLAMFERDFFGLLKNLPSKYPKNIKKSEERESALIIDGTYYPYFIDKSHFKELIEIRKMLEELGKINIRSSYKENVVFKLEPLEFTNYLKTISVFDELNEALLKSTGLDLNALVLEHKNNALLKSMGLDLNGSELAHKKILNFEKKEKVKRDKLLRSCGYGWEESI